MGYGVLEGANEVKRLNIGTESLVIASSEALNGITIVGDQFKVSTLGMHLAMIHMLPGGPTNQNGYTAQLYNVTQGAVADSETRTLANSGMQVFLFTFNVTDANDLYEIRIVVSGGVGNTYKIDLSPLVFKMVIMPMTSASASGVTGSGTAGYITKWTAASVIGNSIMTETGTQVTTAGSINVAGVNTDTFAALKDGQNVPVSAANEGRLRYNGATSIFQASVAGGAWVGMPAGAGVANRIAKWTNAATLGSSQIIDTGAQIQLPIAPLVSDADADFIIQSTAATQVPLVVQGFTAQADNLTEWHNAAGANLAKVAATGAVTALDLTVGLGSGSGADGKIVFANTTNANTLTIQSGVTAATHALTLPLAQGGANTFLRNDGSGVMSWAAAGGASGTGTLNVVPKITNATGPVYGDSSMTDDGTTITTAESLKINSNTSRIRFGTVGDVGIGFKTTNTVGITDGGASDAIRISSAGRIYGNAVTATPDAAVGSHTVDGAGEVTIVCTATGDNVVVGQTISVSGWTWAAGGGDINGTWLVTAVYTGGGIAFNPTLPPTAGSNPTVVGTVTVIPQIILGNAPTTGTSSGVVLVPGLGIQSTCVGPGVGSGNYSASFGGANVTGLNSTGLGYSSVVTADYAVGLGCNSVSRVEKTCNISGLDCARLDDGQPDYWLYYGSRENIVYGPEVDLLGAPVGISVTIPPNSSAWISEVGWIVSGFDLDGGAITVQPTIEFGITGTLAKYLAAQPTTLLTGLGKRERYTTLLADDGEQTALTANMTVAGTIAGGGAGVKYKARPFWVLRAAENSSSPT